jgi:uncharacterized protein (TIRG00374 family)
LETSSKSQTNTVTTNQATSVSYKERLKLILKFALVGVVFYYLYHKGLVTGESFNKLFASKQILAICSVLMLVNTLCWAMRWKVLLDTQGAVVPFGRVLKLNMIGSFFNIALPGAVSGDFIKAIYVAKQFKDKRAAVFGSMLFDRILGVTAMVFVAAFSAVLSVFLPWGGALPPTLLYAVIGLGTGSVLFFIYLFSSHKKDPLFHVLQFFTRRSEKLIMIDKLYLGVMGYRNHPRRVLKAIPLSIAIHFMVILLAFFISVAVCTTPISLVALAVIVPIGMLATTIPLLPAGVGTGHVAFYALFKMVGSDQGAEVFSLIVLYQILVGLIGGVVYLKVSAEKDEPAITPPVQSAT